MGAQECLSDRFWDSVNVIIGHSRCFNGYQYSDIKRGKIIHSGKSIFFPAVHFQYVLIVGVRIYFGTGFS